MVLKRLSSWYGSAAKIWNGATYLKLAHRATALFGMSLQIIVSAVEAAATLNIWTWIYSTGRVLISANQEMIRIVETLNGGVGQLRALQLTLALYGLIYFQFWVVKKISNFVRWIAVDNVVELPLNKVALDLVALFLIFAPLQVIGAVIMTGSLAPPFTGFWVLLQNIDIWLDPVSQVASEVVGNETLNTSTGESSDLSNTSSQVFT